MEIRKVQISGGSSFIVSLPKKWVKSTNIKKNDPVGLIIQQDGTLLVTPNIEGEQVQKTREFEVGASTDPVSLLRSLIGAYIAGYNTIRIRAAGRLPPFVTGLVREFTTNAVGQEVVEETDTTITLKDLLNPSEMPFENSIRRMSVIVRGMHNDAVLALKNGDRDLAQDVISRDTDVDRLHWLIARQNNLIAGDVNLSRKMEIPVIQAQHYFLVSRIIERIADHATRIGHYSLDLIGKECTPDVIDLIDSASNYAQDIFERSMHAFHEEDLARANETIALVNKLNQRCRKISTRAMDFDAEIAINIVHIADSIRRIGDYSADICESLINYIIQKE